MDTKLQKVVIDTSALMQAPETVEKIINFYNVIIPIVAIQELDNLKENIDVSKRIKAMKALRVVNKYKDNLSIDLRTDVDGIDWNVTNHSQNDDIIINCALNNKAEYILTYDISVEIKAKSKGVNQLNIYNPENVYKGFYEVSPSDAELANVYENPSENIFGLIPNQYLVIKNPNGDTADILKWNGQKHLNIYNKTIKSSIFGDKIRPKDIYQKCVIDSIISNMVTFISGKQGSGKSLLALATAMHLIESGKYDRIVMLFNPVKVRGVAEMGYYGGSQLEKTLAQFVGNMLYTKIGDAVGVQSLMARDQLRLVSMADCRGMEIRDNEILFISEAQNTNSDIMQLCLSRVADGSKVIIEGDYQTQVDRNDFSGESNGMKKAIDCLKGSDIFGYVELQNVWRSKLANLVQAMSI